MIGNSTTQNNYIDYLKNVRISQHHMESAKMESEKIGIQKGIQKGEKIGIQKGEKIGINKGKMEVVLNAFDNGYTISSIAKITKLSIIKVKEILKSNDRKLDNSK